MKYKINIKEYLERIVEIEAEDKEEALRKLSRLYKTCEIVLTADDYKGTTFLFMDED